MISYFYYYLLSGMGRFFGKNRNRVKNRVKKENRRLIESAINRRFFFKKSGFFKKSTILKIAHVGCRARKPNSKIGCKTKNRLKKNIPNNKYKQKKINVKFFCLYSYFAIYTIVGFLYIYILSKLLTYFQSFLHTFKASYILY